MLCLVLAAYCSLATAEHTYLSPRNHSQFKEESSFTSTTSSVDPWSPVVGDTEGAPGVTTRGESVHGRRAAISLVENIRRQLMRDNYDYISDKSEEPSMIKTSSPSHANSKRSRSTRKTSIQTAMPPTGSPKPSQTSPGGPITLAALPLRRTRMLPPLSVKQMLSQIQVARVDMPSKTDSKQHFRSYSESPTLRSLDQEPQRQATTMAKDVKSEIDVSKKDLLFYIDDTHLRRNNPHSVVSSITGRREYEPTNMRSKININRFKQNRIPTQKLNSQNSVKDKYSDVKYIKNYDINLNHRRSNQADIKTQSHPDHKNEAVEADGDVSFGAIDDKKRMEQDDKKKTSSISERSHQEAGEINKLENRQKNVSLSANSVNHDMTQEPQPPDVNKDINQNYQENRKQKKYDEKHKMHTGNREQFRRRNHRRNHRHSHRRKHNRHHKYIEQPNESQHGDSTDDKDIQHSIGQEGKPQINSSGSTNIYNEHSKNKLHKHKPPKSIHEKKVQHSNNYNNENREHTNKRTHNVHKNNESGREKSSNKRKRNRYQSEVTVTQKSNEPEKQSDDNSLYTQNINNDTTDIKTDQAIIRRNSVHSATSDHPRHILKKVIKNNNVDSKQSDSVNQKDNHFSNNMDIDNTHDELEIVNNEDKNQQYKDQESQYIDSIDNEDFDKFDGRRMSRLSNDTQFADELDVQDGECNNSQHGCFSEQYNNQSFTTNEEELTSPTAKYKLLKVRAAGGSRRSNAGERQFLQERGPKGVALFALDGAPFPQFRLPRSRRQYMDDQVDKRPPLMEQMSRRSFNKEHSKHRSHKHED